MKTFAHTPYFQIVPRLCVNCIDFLMVLGDHMTWSDYIYGSYLRSIGWFIWHLHC